jgi:Fungal Zn(2)-Cys(6) binuclear cluster domain
MSRQHSVLTNEDAMTRRKSCGECVKAKRRCDLLSPACTRCTKRRLNCSYAGSRNYRRSKPDEDGNTISIDFNNLTSSSNLELLSESTDSVLMDYPASTTQIPDNDHTTNLLNENGILEMLQSPEALYGLQALEPAFLRYPSAGDFIESYQLMRSIEGSTFTDGNMMDSSPRILHAMEEIKAIPELLIKEDGTGWIHPMLYREYMPRSMQDAYAACGLYINKNPKNQRNVFRFIGLRSKELTSMDEPVEPIDLVARIQALLLYQIIRLLDGDIRQRANGEADLNTLDEWARRLRSMSKPCNESLLDSQDDIYLIPQSFESWILDESVRRTYLFANYFIAFHKIVKVGTLPVEGCHWINNGWTASAHLWRAPSKLVWQTAWTGKLHFVVKEMDVSEILKYARAGDIDEFGKLIIATLIGIDNFTAWTTRINDV